MSALLKKYHQLSPGIKASFWFASCSIAQKGIQLITVPLFTRLLTPEQYGQFSLYQSWYSVISIFATLNLALGVFNNGMIKFQEDRPRYISSMQGLSTTVTVLFLIIYLATPIFWNEVFGLPTIVILSMFAELLMAPALAFWSARQRFEYKYVALVAMTLGISVLSPALGLWAVQVTQEKGMARILSVSLVNICAGLFFYIYNMWRGKAFFVKKYWKFALMFNLPLLPHYLSAMVLGQADRIMIEKMFGTGEVAIYSVAYSISLIMNIVTSSINASFIPWTYQKCAIKDYQNIGKTANILLTGIAAFSLIPILLAPEVMSVMAPPEYAEAIWIIPPIATSVFFTFLYSLFGNIEFYFEENKFVMIASVLAALSNIVLNAIFMPLFGYMAAGYTTMICYIFFAIAHYIFMRKVCKIHIEGKHIYNIRLILIVSVGYLACTGLVMLMYPWRVIRYGTILAGGVLLLHHRKSLLSIIKRLKV